MPVPPDDLNGLLRELAADAPTLVIAPEDRAFIDRVLRSVTTGSQGFFAVVHPGGPMQYILLNVSGLGAITLLARLLTRLAEEQNL